jgi:alkylated DNA repair dioxygenase AlkB
MGVQGDLFADHDCSRTDLPQGMTLSHAFVTAEEEAELSGEIDAAPLSPFRFHQWEGKRLTASYGQGYDFGRGAIVAAPPFPAWLRELANRAATRSGFDPESIVQGLVIRYDPGAGIGWHRDRPLFGSVLGLSLTSEVVLRLRRPRPEGFERRAIRLPRRSLYRLAGPARWEWEHSIVPVTATRRSITLRSLRTPG